MNGRQEPRVLLRPKFDSEDDAHDAVDLIASCGQTLDPFQVLLVCITLATLRGRLAASEAAALVARQNGKGGWLEAVAIWSLFEPLLTGRLSGRKNTTLWTAHELKTSDEAYSRVKSLIEANPDLAAEVVVWNGGLTGTHIIELRDGSRLVFLARSKSSGRGFSPRRIIFDEAQEFSALAFRAMMYATSAQGANRQLIYAGTVPSIENDSAIWTGVRDRGRAGKVARLAWAEWSPKDSNDPGVTIDPTDWDARAWSNPALGSRILHETIDEEWEAAQADLEGFLRERMSVWPSIASGPSIFPNWSSLAGERQPPMALGVSADRRGNRFVLGGASAEFVDLITPAAFEASGPRVPSAQRALFVSEVARIARELDLTVGLQEKGPAWILKADLEDSGVHIVPVTMDDFVQACADFNTDIGSTEIRHSSQAELDTAVQVAIWRDYGKRQVISAGSADIPELEAVLIARHVATQRSSDVWEVWT